ncbi:hypothetical protein IJ00_03185 [Calothrix sp. 336/3]|nr:hypothetical protein IJ00_03185 [Calothrix sp. 336/3]
MNFFTNSAPLLRRKPSNPQYYSHYKYWFIDWQIGKYQIYSNLYTQIDLACILWAFLVFIMFVTAQFFPVSWVVQTVLWSALSLICLIAMIRWTKNWVTVECVNWLLNFWVVLVIAGLLCTNLSIFLGWGIVLIHLCSLWLGVASVGYLLTGITLHSRALIVAGIFHLLVIWFLPFISAWQFLFTGTFMAFFLVILAEFQWDRYK